MRLLAVTLICLAAAPAQLLAEGWQIMYLADSGGSRPMQVGPDDGGIPFAYVDNDRGERLTLACRWTGSADLGHDWTLEVFPGPEPTFLPKDAEGTLFLVTFDSDTRAYELGDFSYVQQTFRAPVPVDIAVEIMQRKVIRLEIPGAYVVGGEAYRTEFTLAGSADVIDYACPAV